MDNIKWNYKNKYILENRNKSFVTKFIQKIDNFIFGTPEYKLVSYLKITRIIYYSQVQSSKKKSMKSVYIKIKNM